MIELAHNGRLHEKVDLVLLTRARFECLERDAAVIRRGSVVDKTATTHSTEFALTDRLLDDYALCGHFVGEFLRFGNFFMHLPFLRSSNLEHRIRIFIGERINVGLDARRWPECQRAIDTIAVGLIVSTTTGRIGAIARVRWNQGRCHCKSDFQYFLLS